MSDRATPVNAEILEWARKRSGLSVEAVATKLGKSVEAIQAWEAGSAAPTYLQLEKLAINLYRRPVALFFYPEPPREEELQHEFRTLPEAALETLPPDVRFELRRARAFQISIRQLSGGSNPAERQIWRDIDTSPEHDVQRLAWQVRNHLGVDLGTQQGWRSAREAMREWRRRVENVGVFILKHPFDTERISGFCLHDPEFPLIMVNNRSTFTRQLFTVCHELAHILFGISGITPDDLDYPERISHPFNRQVEVACNALAAEVLVPSESLPFEEFAATGRKYEMVAAVAKNYCVSREVIARKLMDARVIGRDTYLEWASEWSSQRSYRRSGGGNYYLNQAAYLGEAFLRLAFSRYEAGTISTQELADHLNMKARTVEKFETELLARR